MRYFHVYCLTVVVLLAASFQTGRAQDVPLSTETEECLLCHADTHPGMVASWQKGRHAKITPAEAMQKPELERRISSTEIDSSLLSVAVGCYECHSINTDKHKDAFEHNGYTINVIVSPDDCATCHPVEADQYSRNLMSQAHTNLVENPLYQTLMSSVNNPHTYAEGGLTIGGTDTLTSYESCLYCHGTKVEVKGLVTKETDLGEFQFPVLEGWPNQGVGRINPDGSKGACTACHTRHDFSIETARKPYTCSECHKGPDVPAFKVYEASKHGNIFKSKGHEYDYNAVPWTVGKDFTAPTCATCHVSLLVRPDQTVLMERTHQFNDRLAWRLFGVPYAYPHPQKADLSKIKNAQGLPLAVELDGTPVAGLVITKEEQLARDARMKTICLSCHSSEWVDNHFTRLENTIAKTNEITYEATKILVDIWNGGYAEGLPQGKNIFDEDPERVWTTLWLFHTNSTRFASAMAGGGDYGVFANGRYQTTGQLYRLMEKLKIYRSVKGE